MKINSRVTLAASVLMLIALGTSSPATAAGKKKTSAKKTSATRTITFQAHYDDIGGVLMPQACGVSQPGLCTVALRGQVKWTGGLVGVSEYQAYAHFNPTTMAFETDNVWENFVSVTVPGCGTGSMMWHGHVEVTAGEQDPTTLALIGHGTWNYVPGTGTGGLAKMVRGTFDAKQIRFQPPFMENHGDVTGTLVCRT